MNCKECRDELRHPGAAVPSAGAVRHAASCPACAAESRAALLLRLGSARDDGAEPRAGFEERLRKRLASGPAPSRSAAWNGGFERLVRPALAVAVSLVLLCAGVYMKTAPEPGADLVSLVESDPVFTSLLAGDPGSIFGEEQGAPATAEKP
jgi:hypothetical protein